MNAAIYVDVYWYLYWYLFLFFLVLFSCGDGDYWTKLSTIKNSYHIQNSRREMYRMDIHPNKRTTNKCLTFVYKVWRLFFLVYLFVYLLRKYFLPPIFHSLHPFIIISASSSVRFFLSNFQLLQHLSFVYRILCTYDFILLII